MPWRISRIDIEIGGGRSQVGLNQWRLSLGVRNKPSRLGNIGFDTGCCVGPALDQAAVPVQGNRIFCKPGIVWIVVGVILMQRCIASHSRRNIVRGEQLAVAAKSAAGRVSEGQFVVVSGALPIVDDSDTVVNPVIGKGREIGSDRRKITIIGAEEKYGFAANQISGTSAGHSI